MTATGPQVGPDHADLGGREAPIRVLHVEDDPQFVDLSATYLRRADERIEVVTETSVADGLERLAAEEIDCVVSDYDMPGRNGLEFLEAVRDRRPDLPFVLFTGKGSEEIASEAISAGVTEYLQKEMRTDQYTVLANRIVHAVEKRRAEQEVYRGFQAMETAKEGIGIIDEDGRYRYVNAAYAEIFGLVPEDVVGEHWEEFYPEDEAERFHEEIFPALGRDGSWSGESEALSADGERVPEALTLTAMDDGGHVCVARDVSDRRQRERALAREQQFLETVLDALGDLFYVFDADGRLIRWNDELEAVTGYGPDDLTTMEPAEFFDDDARDRIREAVTAVIDDGDRVTVEASILTAEGEEIPYELTGSPVEEDGEVVGLCGIGRDLTTYVDARDLQVRLIESSPTPTLVLDAEGDVSYCNDALVEFLDAPDRDAVLGERALEFIHPDQRPAVAERVRQLLEERAGTEPIEQRIVGFDGRTRRAIVASAPVVFDGEPSAQVVLVDMTREHSQQRRLERKRSQLDHLGSVLSHDMKSPIATARGALELARETDEQRHFDRLDDALDRLDELRGDVAALLEGDGLVEGPEPVSLEAVVETVAASLPEDLSVTVEGEATVRADRLALKRLLQNLLSNACEHAGPSPSVVVEALPDGFAVADDGPGIDPDVDGALFEPGSTTKERGPGLGLVSVEQIALAHGWTVEATESDRGGARFEVTGVERTED